MTHPDPAPRRKARLQLVGIAMVFLLPMLVAGALGLAGWLPGTKSAGEAVLPERNFVAEQVRVALAAGGDWAWRDSEPRMTLVAFAGPGCAERCYGALEGMAQARLMLGRNQPRLRLLYVGTPPADPARRAAMAAYWSAGESVDPGLARFRPQAADSVAALLVESNGTALAYYPAGFDGPALLRDLLKVVK